MAVDAGTLIVTMGLESAGFSRGLASATAETRRFETATTRMSGVVKGALAGMVAGFSTTVIFDAMRQGLEYASSLGEVAQQVGVTTRTLQQYRYVATQVGLSQEEMDSTLQRLVRTMGQSPEKFERLGISIRDANGELKDAGEIIPLIAERLQGMDAAERAAVQVDLLGRSGQKMGSLMAQGADGIRQMIQQADDLGMVITEEDIEKADRFVDSWGKLRQTINIRIASVAADNADGLNSLAEALTNVATAAINALGALGRFWEQEQRAADAADRARRNIRRRAGESDASLGARRNEAGTAAVQATRREEGYRPVTTLLGGLITLNRRQDDPPPNRNRIRNLTDDAADYLSNSWPRVSEQVVDAAADMAAAARRIDQQVVATISAGMQELIDKSRELEDAGASLIDRLFPDVARARQYQDDLRELNRQHDANEISADLHASAVNRLYREYRNIADIRDVARDSMETIIAPDVSSVVPDNRDIGRDLLREWGYVTEEMEARNVRIVESFAQLSQGALNEIDRLVKGVRDGNVVNVLSGIIGFLDRIGQMIPGGFNLGPLRFGGARAMGGPVAGGTSYLVGERGPEIFTPGRSGSITPNHRLGGQAIHVTVNAQGAVLTDQVRSWVEDGVRRATGQGAALGSQLAQSAMARRQSRVPA